MTEPIPAAKELLDFSDLAFGSGDFREGSRLVWEAAQVSIAAVAAKRGWPCGSLAEIKQVIYRLDGIDEDGNFTGTFWHFMHFAAVDGFREHAETDEWEYPQFQWEPYQFRSQQKSVKRFLAVLAGYVESEPDL